jgi:1,5-anhydro-D-fructose reductase (1,5-anhydro-D-mannitol-forming)
LKGDRAVEEINKITSEDTKITGWGIIGTGRHPDQRIIPAMKLAKGTRVVAVYSRDVARAQAFAQKHNIQKAYDSLDDLLGNPSINAVFIASPNSLHASQTIMAAKAGKHVLVEKPMAVSIDEGVEMIQTCRSYGIILGIGFQLRHDPGYKKVRRLIREGVLGAISMAQAQQYFLMELPVGLRCQWWQEPEMIGGSYSIMAMGVHLIDLLQYLLGQPITEVAAITDGQTADRPLDQIATVAVRFRDGPIGMICCGRLTLQALNGVAIYGNEGIISTRGTVADVIEVISKSGRVTESYERDQLTMYKLQIEAFNKAILENGDFEASGIDGLKVVQVTSAVIESARTGRSIVVDTIRL